jgi:hypothetical protein
MTSKIKIKMGAIEIEYEGSEAFLKEELPSLLKAVSDLYQSSGPFIEAGSATVELAGSSSGVKKIQGTTATLAAKLGGGSGPELMMSAAARITFVLGKEKFHRKDLLEEIKSASNYYKNTYMSNFSSLLNGLVKTGKLMEPSKDNYSLSADSVKNIGAQLA